MVQALAIILSKQKIQTTAVIVQNISENAFKRVE